MAISQVMVAFLRRRKANANKRVDNSRLPAGSNMYFFCDYCSAQTDVLPECYMTTPKKVCDECKKLVEEGLLTSSDKV